MKTTQSSANIKWVGKLQPTFTLPKTQPVPLTSAAVRRLVQHFEQHGVSIHSAYGATLWALLDWLQGTAVPYTLHAMPGVGYEVRRLAVPEIHLPPKGTP
jgi:uncharacterized protein RhaS with RHS repeats